jgi:hypothetical protein
MRESCPKRVPSDTSQAPPRGQCDGRRSAELRALNPIPGFCSIPPGSFAACNSARGEPESTRWRCSAVALDAYVKAQTSTPQVAKRITDLENCLQRLANAALASGDIDRHPDLRAAAEEAKLVLKNRLEVDDTKHRFRSELGLVKDELGLTKP